MDFSRLANPFFAKDAKPKNGEKRKYCFVVDDDPGDRLLMKKALEENQVHEEIRFATGGIELVELLKQCKPTLLNPVPHMPCLILLDLYMPRMDGHQVLRVIKGDLQLRKIPTIILTASHSLDDIVQSYHDGANSFLTKPLEYDRLVSLIGLVKSYWLEESWLPV